MDEMAVIYCVGLTCRNETSQWPCESLGFLMQMVQVLQDVCKAMDTSRGGSCKADQFSLMTRIGLVSANIMII
jgi:hypothetical protein